MKILIGGAGGAPSEGVVESLKLDDKSEDLIGMGSDLYDLGLSGLNKKYKINTADHPDYRKQLSKILQSEKPDLLHVQNDLEVMEVSKYRDEIQRAGTKLYMPDHDVIDCCVYKHKSYEVWNRAGIKVPQNMVIENAQDLTKAFEKLGNANGSIWLRSMTIGGGGKGALPTHDVEFAAKWIERYRGWGEFVAAEMLTHESATWLSIWHQGELVVAQSRKRKGWTHANRTLSGVTGVTKIGETFSNDLVNTVAKDSILSIDKKPHGIYGVDMAYDEKGTPNPTEINISRFFTTILFFTKAGLNMPVIYKNIALHNEFPSLEKKINPLKDGLIWIRGMDRVPVLTTEEDLKNSIQKIN